MQSPMPLHWVEMGVTKIRSHDFFSQEVYRFVRERLANNQCIKTLSYPSKSHSLGGFRIQTKFFFNYSTETENTLDEMDHCVKQYSIKHGNQKERTLTQF